MRLLYIAAMVVLCLEVVSCITHGKESKPGQWPFMAALFGENGNYLCGGVVWNERTIITAISCLSHRIKVHHVYLGNNENLNWKMDPNYVFTVEKVELFAGNISFGYYSLDIALLTLNRTIDFNNVHNKVRCAGEPVPATYVNQELCISIGWGESGSWNKLPSLLKYTKTPIQDQRICEDAYEFYNMNQYICAGDSKGKIARHDYGGPLICPIKDYPSRYKLVAITSMISSEFTLEEYYSNDDPGFYCLIDYYYYDWILQKAGNACSNVM